jgi:hypothetical protein
MVDTLAIYIIFANPFKVESIELDLTELEQIEFIGSAKPLEGGLGKERAERKEAQLKNMIKTVIDMSRDGDKIVDFCSGGGHLGEGLILCNIKRLL